MVKIEACDICGSTFGDRPVMGMRGPEMITLDKVMVINLRIGTMGVICSGCAPPSSKVLTAFGIPHRYDAYEQKFFVGNDFATQESVSRAREAHEAFEKWITYTQKGG